MRNYKILILITIIFLIFLSGCVAPEQTTMSLDGDDSPNIYKININNTEKIIHKTQIFSSNKNVIYQGVVTKFSMYPAYTIQFEDGYILTTNGLANTCNLQLGKINRIRVLKREGFIGGAWDGNIANCEIMRE